VYVGRVIARLSVTRNTLSAEANYYNIFILCVWKCVVRNIKDKIALLILNVEAARRVYVAGSLPLARVADCQRRVRQSG